MTFLSELPSLAGRRGRTVAVLYRALAGVVIALTLLGLGALVRTNIWDEPAEAEFGITVGRDALNRPVLDTVWPAATSAGAVQGARVVAVNGTPLGSNATKFTVGRYVREASGTLRLNLLAEDGSLRHVELTRDPDGADYPVPGLGLSTRSSDIFYTVSAILFNVCPLVISFLLFGRRSRDPEAMLLAFGFLLMALPFGLVGSALPPDSSISPAFVSWAVKTLYTAGFWCMLVGICAFPDGRFVSRWSRFVRWVPTTYLVVNSATKFVLWKWDLATYFLDIPIFVLVVASLFIRYRLLPPGLQRQQIKWTLFGGAVMVIAALIVALVTTAPVQAALGPATANVVSEVGIDIKQLAFPLGLLISLLRYRLYDADTVITRSTVYATLALALVAVFACTEKMIELLGEEYLGHSLGALAGGLGAAISAVMVAPLHHGITHWVEHRFRRDLLHVRENLPTLVSNLSETTDPATLADAVVKRITTALHAVRGLIADDEGNLLAARGLSDEEIASWRERWRQEGSAHRHLELTDHFLPIHVPLDSEGAPRAGWLLLGPRPDGTLYGKDERQVLKEFAEPIARGLARATRREEKRADEARDRGATMERFKVLEEALAGLIATSGTATAFSAAKVTRSTPK